MVHPFPGNVRELENAIEHAFVLCSGGLIDMPDLPVEIRHPHYLPSEPAQKPDGNKTGRNKTQLTRDHLVQLLEQSNWNKAETARQVGVSRTAIWKYMKKWNIPLERL